MGKTKRENTEVAKSDPVSIKLALSQQLERELNQTGFDYIVLLIDKGESPDIAIATKRSHSDLPRLLRLIASRLENGGVDLPSY